VFKEATLKVVNETKVRYGQGLQCADGERTKSGCKPMDLLLDIISPASKMNTALRPAYIIMHGGGWIGGGIPLDHPDGWTEASSMFFASRGFVCFIINYRLQKDNGTYPKDWPLVNRPVPGSHTGLPAAEYPATRDLKAAIRFVRANSEKYGVDPSRIAIAGGSAGSISSIAAGVVDEDDYKTELLADDPTLASTHLNTSSKVQCVVSHWGAGYGEMIVQAADPTNRSRYTNKAAPVIEFHGDKDTTVPFADALAVEAAYQQANSSGNLAYEMNVLKGCGHTAWCAGCPGQCKCKDGHKPAQCDGMDRTTLPFLVQHLDLVLQ
jgi:acetyl esterase/lipase